MTPGGVVATQIKAANLPGIMGNVFRDMAPEGLALPYVTFIDWVSDVPSVSGDGRTLWRRRLVQVDLWQSLAGEDLTLADALVAAVDGFKPGAYTTVKVTDTQRLPETLTGISHVALTLSLNHR